METVVTGETHEEYLQRNNRESEQFFNSNGPSNMGGGQIGGVETMAPSGYVAPDESQDDKKAKNPKGKDGLLFKDHEQAYNYMFSKSYSKSPYKEQFGWVAKQGIIVLSDINNDGAKSDEKILPLRSDKNGAYSGFFSRIVVKIHGTIHTHPYGPDHGSVNGDIPKSSGQFKRFSNIIIGENSVMINMRGYETKLGNIEDLLSGKLNIDKYFFAKP